MMSMITVATLAYQSKARLMGSQLVFVYGTLKKGFMNHGLIKDQRFLGEARTEHSNFIMRDLGSYPGVIKTLGGGYEVIQGELYHLNDEAMEACDRLEGHPDFYCRELTPVKLLDSGDVVQAWIYIFQGCLGARQTPSYENISVWEKPGGN